jgi:hypothetical protein
MNAAGAAGAAEEAAGGGAWRRVELGLFAAAFALHAWAAAPGNEWLDSGELVAAGFTLGVSHPPAQPGHALLVKAASFFPVGEVAFRASLLSALAAALGVSGTFALARALLPRRAATLAAGLAAAVFVALAPLAFEQATRPEVYAPTLALVTYAAAWTVAFVREGRARDALGAAFAFALAATIHPLVAAMAAAPCALAIAWRARRRLLHLGPAAVALGVLALVAYAYLPLRAAAPARALLVWGQPDTWPRFFDVVTAHAYGGNFAGAGLAGRAVAHLLLVGEGVGLVLLLLGGAGLVFAVATRLRGALPLAGAVVALVVGVAAQRVFYPDNPDVHGYLAPVLPLLAAGLAALLVGGARAVAHAASRLPEGVAVAILAGPALFVGLGTEVTHARDARFRRDDDASAWTDATLARVPPGPALYVADSDHALFSAMYERLVAGDRPDVAIASLGLTSSSWFLRMIDREQPALFVPFVDDGGQRGALAERLLGENLRAGRPVRGENPAPAPFVSIPAGRLYVYALPGAASPAALATPAPPPLRFAGEIGRRAAGHAGLVRARFEAARGRWLDAVRAAGALVAFDDAALARLGAAPATAPLYPQLPAVTPIFIFADWQVELVARDAGFAAGLGAGAPPGADAPLELRLLHEWHRFLLTAPGAEDAALAALGVDAQVATGRMLIVRALPADAERVLRAALARDPGRAEAWKHLGVALALGHRPDEARAAWQRSLALDPLEPEVARWLADAEAADQNQKR